MKQFVAFLISLWFAMNVQSQTVIFHENFELPSLSDSLISSTSPSWSISNQFATDGTRSDSARLVNANDVFTLRSLIFSTIGNYYVQLSFNHICKIDFADAAIIEVSTDNGVNWTQLTASQYLGSGQFGVIGNKFGAVSYTLWDAPNATAIPNNSWWKNEIFDISSLASNAANVKIRFKLSDMNANGGSGNFGWFIDQVKVLAAYSEINPPTILMISEPLGSVYGTNAALVKAKIIDYSGLDTVKLIYSINGIITDTIGMSPIGLLSDTFQCSIPFVGFGRTIGYKIEAIDASLSHNVASYPGLSAYNNYVTVYSSGGSIQLGYGTLLNSSSTMPSPYALYYTGNKAQYLITASEIIAAGGISGLIDGIAFNVQTPEPATNYGASTGSHCKNYTIKMKNTTATAATSTFQSGLTQVYSNANYASSVGWNNHLFNSSFLWDGTSNILVEVCFDNYAGSSDYSNNAIAYYNQTSYAACTYYQYDYGGVCNHSTGSIASYKPNMKFIFSAPVLTNDVGINQLISPNSGVAANTNFNVQLSIKNFGVDTINTATIRWKVDGIIQTPYAWSGQLLPNTVSSPITIGVSNLVAGIHQLEIWTDLPNANADMNLSNDSVSFPFMACQGQLSGSYTIGGSSADFASFSDALLSLNQCGISSPVTFNVANGIYNEQLQISNINGASTSNTVTFQSASNDSSAVVLRYHASGVNDNYVVNFDGASHLIFKQISFQSMGLNFSNVLVMNNFAKNIKFLNNVFLGGTASLTDDAQSIFKSLSNSLDSAILFQNNRWMNGYSALVMTGPTISNLNRKIEIIGNIFKNQSRYNAYFENINALKFVGNVIENDSVFSSAEGVFMKTVKFAWRFNNNTIRIAQGLRAISLVNCNSLLSDPALFYNNMISLGGLANNAIELNASNHIKLYFNNINRISSLSGNAIYLNQSSGLTNNISLVNNNFTNTANQGFAININFGLSGKTILLDHNNYFSNSSNLGMLLINAQNLTQWKSLSGQDLHSIASNPLYTSHYDLHVGNNLLNGAAQIIAGITDDVDGEMRNSSKPDIGADEFNPSNFDLACFDLAVPHQSCGMSNSEPVQLKIKNIGANTVNGGFSASYTIVGNSTIVTENITQALNSGDTLSFTFSTTTNFNVNALKHDSIFGIKAWINYSADLAPQNDSIQAEVYSAYKPSAPIVSNVNLNYGNSTVLSATSNDSLHWYDQLTANQSVYEGKYFNTGILYDTTTFYVEAIPNGGDILITEITQYKNGIGATPIFPSWINGSLSTSFTGLELSNLSATTVNLSGWTLVLYSPVSSLNAVYTFPNSSLLARGEVAAVDIKSAISGTNLANHYFCMGSTASISSTSQVAYILKNAQGEIVDVVGLNSVVIPSSTGVTASDWTGNAVSTSGLAGLIRTQNDFNKASDWVPSSVANKQTIGALNPSLRGTISMHCKSDRVPITVNIVNFPYHDAGINQIISPSTNIVSGIPQTIVVQLKNYGFSSLQSANIQWKINGISQNTFSWSGNLAKDSSITVVLDTLAFTGGLQCIKAWTILPNGFVDMYPTNDTIQQCVTACMSGAYTIGQTSGNTYDYSSFNQAIAALTAGGICGPVTFLVDSGEYNERLTIPNIIGSSKINTVTFTSMHGDSSQVVVKYATSSSAFNVVKINSSNVNFTKITIMATGSASYGRVVEIAAGMSNIKIMNARLIGIQTTSANNYMSIVYANGTGINDLLLKNNLIRYGSYPIYLYGNSTNYQKRNVIEGNQIIDYYYWGPYTYYNDSMVIRKNTVQNLSSNTYIYGFYLTESSRLIFEKNKININSYSTSYAVRLSGCDGTSTQSAQISNNFISINGGASGTWSGFYIQSSTYCNFNYNSVNIHGGGSSSSAFYLTSSTNISLLNNIFANTTGLGYSIYISSPTGIVASDFNDLYANGTNLAYWSGNKTSLSALRAVSLKDSNSVSILPPFTTSTDLHLLNTNLSTFATPLSYTPDDIDDHQRTTTPTIGAHEVAVILYDGGVLALLYPDTVIENALVPIQAVIKNFGVASISNFPIHYQVNQGAISSYTYSGTLLPNSIDTVTLPSFNAPAGISQVCASTLVPNDTNTFNNEVCKNFFGNPLFDAKFLEVVPLTSSCGMTTEAIQIKIKNSGNSIINGNLTAHYQMVGSSTVVNETISTNIPIGDTLNYNFNTLANLAVSNADSVFEIKLWVDLTNDNISYNDSGLLNVLSKYIPSMPTANNVSVGYGNNALLTASSTQANSLYWFVDSIGNQRLKIGNQYLTNQIYNDTSFWVEANTSENVQDSFGNAYILNSLTGYPAPYSNYYGGTKHQMLFRASELLAAGFVGGQQIDSLTMVVAQIGTSFGGNLYNFRLDMGLTTDTVLNSNTFVGGLTNVVQSTTFPIIVGNNMHRLSTPFVWDGQSNLVIQTFYNNGNNGTTDHGISMPSSDVGFIACNWYRGDGLTNNYIFNALDPTSSSSKRPNITFFASGGGCASARKEVLITVTGQPSVDLGVESLYQPSTKINLTSQEAVQVKIKNYGTNAQSNVVVNYQVNGGSIVSDTISSSIASGDTLIWVFSQTANLSTAGNFYHFKVWTSISGDTINFNDTLNKTIQHLNPNFCIPTYSHGTSDGDYIGQVKLLNLNNISNGAIASPYYTFYANISPVNLTGGANYQLIVAAGTVNINNNIAAWIDFNLDGDFYDSGEKIGEVVINASFPTTDTIYFSTPQNCQSGLTRLRVREVFGMGGLQPCDAYYYGETEDYNVYLTPQIQKDAGLVAINKPYQVSTSASPDIELQIVNYGADTLSSIPVHYILNGANQMIVVWTGTLATGDSATLIIPNVNLQNGNNSICAFTQLVGDLNSLNDSVCKNAFVTPVLTLPFSDQFETNSMWHCDTLPNQWQRGIPYANNINAAHSPNNVWMTQLDTGYLDNCLDYLYSPNFYLPSNSVDSLVFWHYFDTETYADFGSVEYLNNQGYWITLGLKNDVHGVNWYNTYMLGYIGWTGNSQGWQRSSISLSQINDFNPITQFRFVFSSNSIYSVGDGWAIDDFEITIKPLPNDVGITSILNPSNLTATGQATTVKVVIENLGTTTQNSIPVSFQIANQIPVLETWSGSLSSGDTIIYTFNTPFVAPSGQYQICATSSLQGDNNIQNDSICMQLSSTPANYDLSVLSIYPNDSNNVNQSIVVKAWIKNMGLLSVNQFNVAYTTGSSLPTSIPWNGTLNAGDSVEVAFPANILPIGHYNLCVNSDLANDAYRGNDTLCTAIYGFVGGLEEMAEDKIHLFQNVPNPAKGFTTIEFYLPKPTEYHFVVTNILGEIILDERAKVSAGKQYKVLDINSLNEGVYFYTLVVDYQRLSRKMLIVK